MPCPAPFSLDSSDLPPRRLGTDIPGYTGHVPRKDTEVLCGRTFRKANDLASAAATTPGPSEVSSPTERRSSSFRSLSPQARELLCPKPVDSTWVHTDVKAPFFSYGKRQDRGVIKPESWDNAVWAANLRSGGEACNLQMEWRYLRSPSNERTFSPKRERPKRSVSPERQIPGYMGYIPGIKPENICGGTFQSMKEEVASKDLDAGQNADDNVSSRSTRSGSRRLSRDRTAHSPEWHIGYGGHIPGYRAENIYGMSHKAATERATKISALSQDGAAAVVNNTDAGESIDRPLDTTAGKGDTRGKGQRKLDFDKVGQAVEVTRGAADRDIRSQLAGYAPRDSMSRNISPEDALWRRCSSRSSSRSRRDVPGYSGHVPQKQVGNVYGVGFRKANQCAASTPGKHRRDFRSESPQWTRSLSPYNVSSGYGGWQPKVGAKNIYGTNFHTARELASAEMDEDQAARTGDINKEWAKTVRAGIRCGRKRSESGSGSFSSSSANQSFTGDGGSSGVKDALGGNHDASRCSTPQRTRNEAQSPKGDDAANGEVRNRSQTPGYAGHIPRKGPCNVLGASFANANKHAAAGVYPDQKADTDLMFVQSNPFSRPLGDSRQLIR